VASFLAISAELLPGVEVGEVEARVNEQLRRLCEQEIGEAELERCRRVFHADWVHGHERIHQQAVAAGVALAQFDLSQPEQLLAGALTAEPQALCSAAGRWLDPGRDGVLGICLPESGAR
jgi:hypothetical protein